MSHKSSDRFIPLRREINWQIKINQPEENIDSAINDSSTPKNPKDTEEKEFLFKALLQNELTGTKIYDLKLSNGSWQRVSNSHTNLFKYSNISRSSSFVSPVPHFTYTAPSQNLLQYHSVCSQYKISPQPFQILDAPDLVNNFYFNVLDWSSSNVICIALNSNVYLKPVETKDVIFLCNFGPETVTSVCFHDDGKMLALGTDGGVIHIWDIEARREVRLLRSYNHPQLICALAWNNNVLTSSCGGRKIVQHDLNNASNRPIQRLVGHEDYVCGLKLSCNRRFLASGGNDDVVCVWDDRSPHYLHRFASHTSAVKALAWSPHQHSVLASGGGAQDQTIRIWNIQSGKQLHVINTDSQVCNLAWSKLSNDFVSSHGTPSNEINVWNYAKLKCVAKLNGHATRTLYMAMSPHGNNVATAGGEELRLWHVFQARNVSKVAKSALDLFSSIR